MNAWDRRARPPLSQLRPRTVVAVVRDFYAEPGGWLALAVCTLVLTYGGGAVMFWYHAIYLGEGGPAISPWLHWLLDSTAGFVALTPATAVILPLAGWIAAPTVGSLPTRRARPRHARSRRTLGRRAVVGGVMLAMVTAPAPLLHDALIGRGTWLADHVTHLLGNGHTPTGEEHEVPPLVEMLLQVAAGIPTYVVLTAVGLLMVPPLHMRPPGPD